ncbi:MAG: TetR/AcrR family transcriptional regulator [Alphaproteobacteria bacterium]|nr:TetR/AcrR family transcriptional regulator [Alphaproteobacteria bacterium]
MARKTYDIQKHKSIMKAATQLFLKHGYSKTSMDQIASRAGVTKQTIYSHYSNKDALFTEMIMALCHKHSPDMSVLKDSSTSVEERLYSIGLGFLRMITSAEGLATTRVVVSEAERKPLLASIFYETGPMQMHKLLTEFLMLQNARGIMHIANPESAASYFYAMLKGRYHLRMTLKIKPAPTQKELEDHVRETVRVFMKIYDGKDPLSTQDVLV